MVPCAADKQDLRLLLLYRTEQLGMRLDVFQPSTGKQSILMRSPNLAPLKLLPVGDSLYVVHTGGVVRLKETPL